MKKRILTIIITLAMAMGMISAATTTVFADNKANPGTWGEYKEIGGEYEYTYANFSPFVDSDRGTMDNPYVIEFPSQLAGLAALVNAYNGESDVKLTDLYENTVTATNFYKNGESQYIKLIANLDLIGPGWIPIGTDSSHAFKGNFDGNGYTISGMTIGTANAANQECQYAGLFGYMSAGSIKNLAVNGVVNVSCSNIAYAGGIVGYAQGDSPVNVISIENCSSNVSVISNGYAGGIAAYTEKVTITNCYNTGSVSGTTNAGGLVGQAAGSTIANCYSTGTVTATTNVGGLVGIVGSAVTINHCYLDMNSASESIGQGQSDGSPVELAQEQMQAASGVEGSLVDALNKYVEDNNSNATLSPWHIHDGGYPTLGNLSYNNGICVCGYAYTHTFPETSNGFCADCDAYQSAVLNDDGYYEISNAGQLYWFAKQVNSGCTGINAVLTADIVVNSNCFASVSNDHSLVFIDANDPGETYAIGTGIGGTTAGAFYVKTGDGYVEVGDDAYNLDEVNKLIANIRPWTPIGNETNVFSGTFDGAGITISGLYLNNSSANSIGLFGYVSRGTVKDLTVSNSFFNGDQNVGGVVGYLNNGTVENCTNYATVSGAMYIGGIVGYCESDAITENVYNISGCYNKGTVSGASGVGGIVGMCNNSSVSICYNFGNVSGTSSVGGVVGLCNNNSSVSGCINNKNVSGTGFVGGVVGLNVESTVKNCYSDNCTVSGTRNVGGIVGGIQTYGEVSHCYNESDVSSTYSVGGVIGNSSNGSVSYCYNTGNVSGTQSVGGVVAISSGGITNITNCYNTGNVSGETNVGGIVGSDSATVSNCYYLADSETDSIDGTTFKTSAQFASGEVAYLLNNGVTDGSQCFYQFCGTGVPNFYPEFGNGGTLINVVYKATKGCTGAYVNDPNAEPEHTFTADSNGFCAACGSAYLPAVLNGDGYYEISNAGQLYWFAQQVNGGNTYINGKLTANIVVNENVLTESGDLNGDGSNFRVWTPIGISDEMSYTGTFDGNGKTISGLYFHNSQDFVGLIGWADVNCIIQNVGVVNSYFSGNNFIGGVVGSNNGKVQNCYNTGTVNGKNNVGGVVGYSNWANVHNCYNTGTVNGTNYAGGVVGYVNAGTVQNCYNTGMVSGNPYVGGVVGLNVGGTVQNCYYNNTAYTGDAIGGNEQESTVTNVEGKSSAQFASGELAYLLNGDQSEIVWYQTCGTGLPAFSGNRVYRNQISGCSEATFKYEYSNEQKAPVTTHDTTKYVYAEASIVNSITATCGDCQAANWTVTLAAPENAVYNGSSIPAKVIGEIAGVSITVDYDKAPINVGTYKASVTLGGVEVSIEYKIAPKVLVPTITGRVTKVYDGTNTVPAGLSITLEGIVGADNVTASAIYTFDSPAAGTTKVNAECILLNGENVGNYTLSASTASADVGEITKAPSHLITAPTAIRGLVYDKQAHPLVTPGAAEFGTFVYSFDCMNWSASIPTAVNAGSYTVFYKVAGDQNHLDTAPAVITVSVAQREIGIIWGQTAFEYNGSRQAPTATATGLMPGDVCTVGTNGWGIYDGTYTITARSVSNPNYKLPAAGTSCQFTITTDYDKEADKVMDAVGDAVSDAANEVYEGYIAPAITNAFNQMLENLFKMFQNLFN